MELLISRKNDTSKNSSRKSTVHMCMVIYTVLGIHVGMEVHVGKICRNFKSGCKYLMSLQVWPPRQDSGSQRRWPSLRTWFLIRHLKRPSNPTNPISRERRLCCVSWNQLMAPTLIRSMEQAPTRLYLQPTTPVPTTSSRGQCAV